MFWYVPVIFIFLQHALLIFSVPQIIALVTSVVILQFVITLSFAIYSFSYIQKRELDWYYYLQGKLSSNGHVEKLMLLLVGSSSTYICIYRGVVSVHFPPRVVLIRSSQRLFHSLGPVTLELKSLVMRNLGTLLCHLV